MSPSKLALIRRGAEQIVPEAELVRKLERSVRTGKPLRVKYGIDPTGIDVHLGHTVPLRKLRLFQETGPSGGTHHRQLHALVGDPSGRDQNAPRLDAANRSRPTRDDYLKQVSKVIDIDKAEVIHNGDWFSKMSFLDVMALTSKITVQRMLERDDFTKRFRAEPSVPIYLHECLYPLMQGQDSVEIHADVELGGSEQLFNLMVGRRLQEDAGQEPQVCLTLPILRGLDGERRMGKSLGNYIGVGEPAYDQFAKTMSIPDTLMNEWFTLLTDRSAEEIARLTDPQATHPRQAKLVLAGDIVSLLSRRGGGAEAAAEWRQAQHATTRSRRRSRKRVFPAASLTDGKDIGSETFGGAESGVEQQRGATAHPGRRRHHRSRPREDHRCRMPASPSHPGRSFASAIARWCASGWTDRPGQRGAGAVGGWFDRLAILI